MRTVNRIARGMFLGFGVMFVVGSLIIPALIRNRLIQDEILGGAGHMILLGLLGAVMGGMVAGFLHHRTRT